MTDKSSYMVRLGGLWWTPCTGKSDGVCLFSPVGLTRARLLLMRTRLSDPDYEPTDEELRELSRNAFSEVGARHRAALSYMWKQIAAAQKAEREALGLGQ